MNRLLFWSIAYTKFKNICTFVCKIESPLPKQNSIDDHPSEIELNDCTIIKFNKARLLRITSYWVKSEADFRTDTAISFIASPDHVIGRDWRMVTDLLKINRTTVNPHLKSFTQDGVEWFTDADTWNRHRESV